MISRHTIRNKYLLNLTDDEVDQLYNVSLYGGEFRMILDVFREVPEEYVGYRIFLLKIKDKIVGWSMYSNRDIFCYVQSSLRRKGFGTELFKRAYRGFNRTMMNGKPVEVHGWNKVSDKFYKKLAERRDLTIMQR